MFADALGAGESPGATVGDDRRAARSTRTKPVRQHRCAGCGCIGRLSLADPAPDDQRPVLRLAWGASGGCQLLCDLCRCRAATSGECKPLAQIGFTGGSAQLHAQRGQKAHERSGDAERSGRRTLRGRGR